ncbi:transmembrane protein 132C [Dipodomys spectabilis]|uniref:transmembrane protein 132C n=1 Tax=Dipodomys spectabilis TaxID=105255 RepID=UPI001C53F364|nr:transmembrane protein 132C [Dipodomys spectabilis]
MSEDKCTAAIEAGSLLTADSLLAWIPRHLIEARGLADDGVPGLSSSPPYLPVSFQLLGAEAAFFLAESGPAAPRNASLRSRAQAFFLHRARQPPELQASLGPFSAAKAVPLDRAGELPWGRQLRARVLRDSAAPGRPRVQVLFHVAGGAWADGRAARAPLPCLRLSAFRDAREVRGGCRPGGPLALCVAELELPPGWFAAGPPGAGGRGRPAEPRDGARVELYYAAQPGDARGACAGPDASQANAIRPGKDAPGPGDAAGRLRRIGAVRLLRAPDGAAPRELRLDRDVAVRLPAGPARPGDVVTASVAVAANSTVDLFVLRAKVKKGINILGVRPREPRQWAVQQEMGNGGKHATTSVACQRLGPGAGNRSSGVFSEVMQMDFEIAGAGGLAGAQPITWQVEYPRRGTTDIAASEIFVSQRDLVGIVPLAMDTELLNTAILTGKTVAVPVRVVSVEENSTVRDVSEQVECKSADEDVIKVSDHCNYVFVNGKEMKGKVDAVVNFTYQHLSAPLHVTVWVPRLPLQIEVSDTELSQIKGWRVPIVTSKRPTRDSEEEEEAEEEEQRGRGCTLQFQHATVRVLTQFVSEGAGPWGPLSYLLSPDWQLDITHLVADSLKLEAPHVATLRDGRVLVGREVGMTTIQVLSPLSDSILAEKTVTVLDDKVSVTELAVQLVAGLSVTLRPSADRSQAVTAVATAEELLRSPKQEAVVSTWLRFSDGSVTPLDIYDARDFSLAATSLDEAVVSAARPRAPGRPSVLAEGEGQGPLLRLDLSIAEACQKSKRRSALAAGVGHVAVKFGQHDADAGPRGQPEDGALENHASDRRPKGPDPERPGPDGRPQDGVPAERDEGAPRGARATARPAPDSKVGRSGRTDGGRPSGEAQLHHIPIDFTNFPALVGLPKAGGGLQQSNPGPGARGPSDLEIGMYALLGVFCLAILVFLINCATFALKYRHKQAPLEGRASVTHAHDWVWLGTEAELLESVGAGPPRPDECTTAVDRGLGGWEERDRLLLNGGTQVSAQAQRPSGPGGTPAKEARPEPLHSPTAKRKKVKFATFSTTPPEDGCSPANPILGGSEDIKWVCPDLAAAAPKELRNYLGK